MHTHRLLRAIVLAGLTLAPPAPVMAQNTGAVTADVVGRLESEIRRILEDTGIPAISIALVRDGNVAWSGAYGLANVGARVAATPDTYFSTGSTFKFVTATAIMQLVEQGKLDLDTPLNQLVGPALAIDSADDVTIRHMLSHHSGLQGPVATVPLWSRMAPRTPIQLIEGTRRIGPPGQEYRYCNECFGIMAWIVERLSGQSYDDYVAEHVLRPLGIDASSTSVPDPRVVELMALPYVLVDNAPVPTRQVRYDVYAAGDIYLRASDMARFLAAQLNGGTFRDTRILGEASVREMQRQQFESRAYGLGTGVSELQGHSLVTHTGSIPGFNSISVGEPATGQGVYIMSNSGQSSRSIGPLARFAMRLMWGENPEPLPSFAVAERVEIRLTADIFDRYVGEYELTPEFRITISRDGERFFLQATGQERIEIFASSATEFFLKEVEASITFGSDEPGGPVSHMILHQGGARRLERTR